MYAIKIVSNFTAFHLADEVTYVRKEFKNKEDFWAQVGEQQPSYQIGDSPTKDEPGWYIDLCLYRSPENVILKEIFVMCPAWIYIMQDGKTIEVIKAFEIGD
jgi:hypothetical protein